jgi:precorrin-6B methylase 2
MAIKRSEAELHDVVRSPSFTPGGRDVAALLELLARSDDETAELVLRALVRAPSASWSRLKERFEEATDRARVRLCDLAGRIAAVENTEAIRAWLEERLADDTPAVRRRAARSLGKIAAAASEARLIEQLRKEAAAAERKAIVDALGKLGGPRSRAAIAPLLEEPGELGRIAREATERLCRREARATASEIDAGAKSKRPTRVLLHVRAGLEPLLVSELPADLSAKPSGRGRVEVLLSGAISRLWQARTFLHFGFPLPTERIREEDGDAGVEGAVVRALTGDVARGIFSTWTRGAMRWRLEWADAGHRRAATLRVARAITARCSDLVNDPREAPWEAVVHKGPGRVDVELWPRGIEDPRFAWRVRTVPAASHPTIAAALARLGGAREGDVVWDPFVGAGAELVERARLGRYEELIGTDTDPEALSAAKANLAMAKVRRVRLVAADARSFDPGREVTLVITNPPMGRRARSADARVGELLVAVLNRAAGRLAVGGRIVWMSPVPAITLGAARELGLHVRERRRVDMGGFDVELQVFERQ